MHRRVKIFQQNYVKKISKAVSMDVEILSERKEALENDHCMKLNYGKINLLQISLEKSFIYTNVIFVLYDDSNRQLKLSFSLLN